MKKNQEQGKTINLKIIAVILSILLWFYVSVQGQLTAQNALEIHLNYYNLAENLTVSGPDTVTVRLWGTLSETDRVEAFIDLNGLGPGSYDLPVTLKQSNRALFSSVEPNRVEIVIREIKENSFSIEARNTAVLPAGFELTDIFVVPERCSVQGNQTDVSKVAAVIAPINLASSPEIQSAMVTLQALDQDGKVVEGVRTVPEKAVVYGVVSQLIVSKKAVIKPVFKDNLPEGYERGQVVLEPQEALVIGTPAAGEAIIEITTEEIDLGDKTAPFNIEAKLVLPEGVKVYPEQVSVYTEIKSINSEETESIED